MAQPAQQVVRVARVTAARQQLRLRRPSVAAKLDARVNFTLCRQHVSVRMARLSRSPTLAAARHFPRGSSLFAQRDRKVTTAREIEKKDDQNNMKVA
ncbi:hypothetical protein MRX96_003786 [Rhipicephalus microplus]